MSEASVDNPIHVAARRDPKGAEVENPSPDSQEEGEHPGNWPVGIAVECDGCDHGHRPEGKCLPP